MGYFHVTEMSLIKLYAKTLCSRPIFIVYWLFLHSTEQKSMCPLPFPREPASHSVTFLAKELYLLLQVLGKRLQAFLLCSSNSYIITSTTGDSHHEVKSNIYAVFHCSLHTTTHVLLEAKALFRKSCPFPAVSVPV